MKKMLVFVMVILFSFNLAAQSERTSFVMLKGTFVITDSTLKAGSYDYGVKFLVKGKGDEKIEKSARIDAWMIRGIRQRIQTGNEAIDIDEKGYIVGSGPEEQDNN
jgi:hypothetical protein